MKQGKLYGVSVGPGDPSLMTLKAVSCIKKCNVLAVPRTNGENSLALKIASGAVNISEKQIEYLDFLMINDQDRLSKNYNALAIQITAHLDAGRDVAVLNLGDASLYSSYSYICRILLKQGYEVETIPGVTSFCACAALLNKSLTDVHEPLHILPASMPDLPSALALTGGKVLMKSGRVLPEVINLIRREGLNEHSTLVADCGLPSQRIFSNIDEATDEGYFSTILITP